MRYTSFGRHFTKVDKLKENDFNFEKRDWMTVGLGDLPEGSKLIMGLNPPFSSANEFISKALTFRPKLLIFTVPEETRRLDKRKNAYDIIWEDDIILAGKSFYLPGSINVHNQQMEQWNIKSPPLYLWSRPDWTAQNKAIAIEHGHIRKDEEKCQAQGNTGITNYLMQEAHDCYGDFSDILTSCGDINSLLDGVPEISMEGEYNNQNRTFAIPEQQYGYGYGKTLQADDDMCIDMELSTPRNSPIH